MTTRRTALVLALAATLSGGAAQAQDIQERTMRPILDGFSAGSEPALVRTFRVAGTERVQAL